jgi:hypothetical protein
VTPWLTFRGVVARLATDALSAHADQAGILRWLAGFERPPP